MSGRSADFGRSEGRGLFRRLMCHARAFLAHQSASILRYLVETYDKDYVLHFKDADLETEVNCAPEA